MKKLTIVTIIILVLGGVGYYLYSNNYISIFGKKISYMCGGEVKIIEKQSSPSMPPSVSYVRTSDNLRIAYYGDWGAYIEPEHFSIDRAQIEQGYTFNKENFCKYLKK